MQQSSSQKPQEHLQQQQQLEQVIKNHFCNSLILCFQLSHHQMTSTNLFVFFLFFGVMKIYFLTILNCDIQNNRKRKQPSSSGAANSTGTGNTLGHSPNSPSSTPFTHSIGDRVGMAGNLHHVSSMPKSSMMYGADGPGLASSSNQMVSISIFFLFFFLFDLKVIRGIYCN